MQEQLVPMAILMYVILFLFKISHTGSLLDYILQEIKVLLPIVHLWVINHGMITELVKIIIEVVSETIFIRRREVLALLET